jgi:hypothetical protein
MNDPQTQARFANLVRKIDDLERKLRNVENIVRNIDSNVAATLSAVLSIKR